MTPARPLAASVAALGIAGVFGVPVPATAAPGPCDRAERYAAQSGAELFRLTRLTLAPPAGDADQRASRADAGVPGDRTGAKGGAGQGVAERPGGTDAQGDARPRGATSTRRVTGAKAGPDATGAGSAGRADASERSATDGGRATSPGAAVQGGPQSTGNGSVGQNGDNGGSSGSGLLGTLDDLGQATGLTGDRSAPQSDTRTEPGPDGGSNGGPARGDANGTSAGNGTSGTSGGGTSGNRNGGGTNGNGRIGADRNSTADPHAGTSNPATPPTSATQTEAPPHATPADPDAAVTAAEQRPGSRTISDVRVGEAKSALVAEATPNSAAVARMVNGSGTPGLNEPLIQQAPPTNAEPATRKTAAAETGPLRVDAGTLTGHARWQPGMACGAAVGDVTRAAAGLRGARVVGIGGDVLVSVPDRVESVSTTVLERQGAGARTVAAASVRARAIELLNGAVTVTVTRPPSLETRMSMMDGGEVRYVPARLEVSGDGIGTTTLDAAGDTAEFTVTGRTRPRTESDRLPAMDALGGAPLLTLPAVPGLPVVGTPAPESASAAGAGARVRISLGDVRQAALGHSIAARAGAVRIAISEGTAAGYDGSVGATQLDLEMGVLESAAVAPEPAGGGVAGEAAGEGGGALPLTGPRVDLLAVGGLLLLGLGILAMVFGVRKRRFRA